MTITPLAPGPDCPAGKVGFHPGSQKDVRKEDGEQQSRKFQGKVAGDLAGWPVLPEWTRSSSAGESIAEW